MDTDLYGSLKPILKKLVIPAIVIAVAAVGIVLYFKTAPEPEPKEPTYTELMEECEREVPEYQKYRCPQLVGLYLKIKEDEEEN